MKQTVLATAMLMLALVGGCAIKGSYCDVARPVYASQSDTPETKRQILVENTKLEKLCGVTP